MKLKPVAGVDVSKRYSDVCILSPENEVFCETRVFHDLTSMQRIVQILKEAKKKYRLSPIVVMESTAHYHRLLLQFLVNAGFEVILVNPLQTSSIKNIGIRKVKTDKADAKRIALLYRLNVYKGSNQTNAIYDSLKDLTRQRSDLVEERIKFLNKLTSLLDQAFPGYDKVFSEIKTKSSLAVLSKFSTPELVLHSRKDAIKKVIGEVSTRGKDSNFAAKKAELLIQTAKTARQISISRESFASLIGMLAEIIITLQNSIDTLTKKILCLAHSDQEFENYVNLLSSIPGIGEFSAIVFLSEIGDPNRFSKAKELVAFCELDPSVKQSGTSISGNTKISKRGSSYIRKTLDICTHVAVHPGKNNIPANPVLAAFYQKKCQFKPPKVAVCACMHKMVLIIFAVLRNGQPFELRQPEEHIKLKLCSQSHRAA